MVIFLYFFFFSDCSCNAVPPWLVGILIVSTSFTMIVSLIYYLHYKKRGMWDEKDENFVKISPSAQYLVKHSAKEE